MPSARASQSAGKGTEPPQRPAALTTSNHEIYAAFRQDGCPLCRSAATSEARYVASLLREGWRDRTARNNFIRAGGFCRRHGWQLYGAAQEEHTGAGVADVYGQLARHDLKALQDLLADSAGRRWSRAVREHLHRDRRCQACNAMERVRQDHASSLVELLGDEPGRDAYRSSDGLCFNHLRDAVLAALGRRGRDQVCRFLLEDWRSRIQTLSGQLAEYDRKRNYNSPDQPTEAERQSWSAVIARYVGQGGSEYGYPGRLPLAGSRFTP